MSGFDKEMQDALRADAEKLRAMGVDVADPVFLETGPQEEKQMSDGDIFDEQTGEVRVKSTGLRPEPDPQERGHGATTGSHHNTSTSTRELEWVQSSTQTWHADTGKGAYRILEVETDWFTASAPRQAALLGSLSTLEDAKAACQSDFQKRITECLEPTNCEPKASGWRGPAGYLIADPALKEGE